MLSYFCDDPSQGDVDGDCEDDGNNNNGGDDDGADGVDLDNDLEDVDTRG